MGRTRLTCRIETCGVSETYDTPEQAIDSDWTTICPVGGLRGGPQGTASVHRAYCPGHSLEHDT